MRAPVLSAAAALLAVLAPGSVLMASSAATACSKDAPTLSYTTSIAPGSNLPPLQLLVVISSQHQAVTT